MVEILAYSILSILAMVVWVKIAKKGRNAEYKAQLKRSGLWKRYRIGWFASASIMIISVLALSSRLVL